MFVCQTLSERGKVVVAGNPKVKKTAAHHFDLFE
jgi:hypothetical protein